MVHDVSCRGCAPRQSHDGQGGSGVPRPILEYCSISWWGVTWADPAGCPTQAGGSGHHSGGREGAAEGSLLHPGPVHASAADPAPCT